MSGDGPEANNPADSVRHDDGVEEEAAVAARSADLGANAYLRAMLDDNFLEYASYVIKDRAIPDVDDGLKPVQRRILWSLHRIDDGKTHKVANVIGDTMKFHPHGDASIGDALVVLANKEYFIRKQGNYGNIFTGHPAAAPRYIECSLSDLGREVLFNDDITRLVDSYDGRNKEPVVLPVKVPALLMLGSYGIAVGMRTQILPHNFGELLHAQIAELHGEEYVLYPDFLQGGLMEIGDYNDGNGRINLRARIEIDGRKLVIREIPATTTTEALIASIERAAEKGKIKIASINDFTAEKVEIEVVPTRGYEPKKALRALYMYTDCAVSVSVNMMVICDGFPREMSVHGVLKRNTEKLLEYLRKELEIELGKLEDQFHAKTLTQIFIENRIYKRIEECDSETAVRDEVRAGLAPFAHLVRREITDDDIARLLTIQIGRISRFSIEKNQTELRGILERIDLAKRHLRHLREYAVSYLEGLLKKYEPLYPRRTEICGHFEKIDRQSTALNNIRIGWDRKNGYIGTGIKSDDVILCNEFDHLLQMSRDGRYKITELPPDKLFVGRLYDCRRHDPAVEFGVIYRDAKSGKCYGKRCAIESFVKEREYRICPAGCRLELLTPRVDAVYRLSLSGNGEKSMDLNLLELPMRSPRARGVLVCGKVLNKITYERYLSPEEVEEARRNARGVDDSAGDEARPAPSGGAESEAKSSPEPERGGSADGAVTAKEPSSPAADPQAAPVDDADRSGGTAAVPTGGGDGDENMDEERADAGPAAGDDGRRGDGKIPADPYGETESSAGPDSASEQGALAEDVEAADPRATSPSVSEQETASPGVENDQTGEPAAVSSGGDGAENTGGGIADVGSPSDSDGQPVNEKTPAARDGGAESARRDDGGSSGESAGAAAAGQDGAVAAPDAERGADDSDPEDLGIVQPEFGF